MRGDQRPTSSSSRSPDAAELAKLLENVFRNVNIALVNQLALLCERMGLDVWEVIDAAATKPFGFMRFTPGPGVGGHCIPVDPYYLAWRAREFDFVDRFVELAGDINLAMPRHVVDLVAEALNEHWLEPCGARRSASSAWRSSRMFRRSRNSPAADVIAGLAERGAVVTYHDPLRAPFPRLRRASVASRGPGGRCSTRADVVVVVTPHRAIDWDAVYGRAALIIDTTEQLARPGAASWAGPSAGGRMGDAGSRAGGWRPIVGHRPEGGGPAGTLEQMVERSPDQPPAPASSVTGQLERVVRRLRNPRTGPWPRLRRMGRVLVESPHAAGLCRRCRPPCSPRRACRRSARPLPPARPPRPLEPERVAARDRLARFDGGRPWGAAAHRPGRRRSACRPVGRSCEVTVLRPEDWRAMLDDGRARSCVIDGPVRQRRGLALPDRLVRPPRRIAPA